MIGDNLINREDSCKVGRPAKGSQIRESPAQIRRVGTFAHCWHILQFNLKNTLNLGLENTGITLLDLD